VIWLEGVSILRQGSPALENITIGVAGAELVVLLGSSGSGKSSLLQVMAGVRAPDSGAVWIAEHNIVGLQASSLPYVRRNIGYLPPEPLHIPDETVLENIMLALAVRGQDIESAEADAREILAMVGDSVWEARQVRHLSTGQQRLVALARALVGPPPLLILDEPAAGLGGEEREAVKSALLWARDQGCAVLCATADASFSESLVEAGARQVRLADGRIVGAPAIGLVPTLSALPNPGEDETTGAAEAESRDSSEDAVLSPEPFSSGKESS
jgi:ABC-type ATPase involved in cell division